uniref:RRM domain-containing protein n=1 Tax=Kalanchoe fedtschenkoi TaxID=63787 RepID=A0A7N0TIK1_KALFE
MYYRGFANNADSYEMGPKRQRLAEHGPSYYGPSPAAPFGYDNPVPAPQNAARPVHSTQPPPFPVVRIRGLPFYCTEEDISHFFYGLDVVDVLLVHKHGRFTGEAYCVFGYPLQVDIALRKDRQNMGSRYVEVFPSKRQEYYKAIANEVHDARAGASPSPKTNFNDESKPHSHDKKPANEKKDSAVHTGVLRMRGLPYSASKDDIVNFFKDFTLSEDAIHFVLNWEGRPSGDAFVKFASAEDSKAAMVKDRMSVGSRYVELFPSTPEEMSRALSKAR